MTSLSHQNNDFIKFLSKLPPQMRQKLLSSLTSTHINTISEIFNNFLLKNLTQDSKVIKRLQKYKNQITEVSRKKTPIYKRKKILKSRKGGAILNILLPIAAAVVSSLFK